MENQDKRTDAQREGSSLGGKATKAKYGREFYHSIGNKGGAATKAKYGPEHYSEIGKRGAASRIAKHGK